MDKETLQFYKTNSAETAERYDSISGGISKYFATSFVPKSKVLDIGCGSGRDLQILKNMQFDVRGVDPCEEFVDIIKSNKQDLQDKVIVDSLPNLSKIEDNEFDGILCSAVLMHLPEEQLFDTSFTIRRILKENGRLLLSIPLEDKTVDTKTNRDKKGRLFNGITPDNLQLIFERIGFKLINRWQNDDSFNRDYRKWSTMLFTLENISGTRPIDTIESILNKDAKTATYKLALFRSFASIAITNYKLAKWTNNSYVKVSTLILAEKWVEYYWPIVDLGIKQKTGNNIAFKTELKSLILYYKMRGGLSAYSLQYKNKELHQEAKKLSNKLLYKLKRTIWNNPVKCAGGGEEFSIFQYDKKDKTVLIPSNIWRELSLMGTWIQDATILRWAELTEKISKKTVKASEVIDCLLTVPIPERDVYSAKSFYDSLESKVCVWSGKTINENKYDVDHAIPFALWKNNDLWNLFPANSKVNGNKKDKLPSNILVKKRKDCFVNYWELVKEKFPVRFEYEAEKIGGLTLFKNNNWQNKLFANFAEAIEITAIQRGVDRWEPASYAATGTDGIILKQTESSSLKIVGSLNKQKKNEATQNFVIPINNDFLDIPFYPNLKIACGTFKEGLTDYDVDSLQVENIHGNLDEKKHFIVCATGDSMNGGGNPICDGDYLLFEKNEGGSISNQRFAIEYQEDFGNTSYLFKRIEKNNQNKYRLVSQNKDYEDIEVDADKMFPFARFKYKLQQKTDINKGSFFSEVRSF